MKIYFLIFLSTLSVCGCQGHHSGENSNPSPEVARVSCDEYADRLAEQAPLPEMRLVQIFVTGSERSPIENLVSCLDRKLTISCEQNLCQIRKK
jgi:hypothetical protein